MIRARLLMLCGAATLLITTAAPGQSVRSLIRDGNSQYKGEKYSDAEVNYRKALEKEQGLVQGHFNLGNALHKEGKFDEAMKEYEEALTKAEQKDTRAYAHYNIGNSQMRGQKYEDAVKSYIEALKLNPRDEDAKYNLSYALEKLRQQQQQQKNKQDKKNQKNKDQDKKDQDKKDQQKKPDQDQQQKKQPQPQPQKQMSKAEADRILNVLKNSEKDVQRKLRVRQAVRPKSDKDW